MTHDEWMVRVQLLSDPLVREARAYACILLGHEPSGEFFAVNPPIHICGWCGAEFRL